MSIWLAAAIGSWWALDAYFSDNNAAATQLTTYLTRSRLRIEAQFEHESLVQIGDPVILYENDVARPVGRIIDVPGAPTTKVVPVRARKATVELFSSAPSPVKGDYLAYHHTPESMEWMVQMMLPKKTRDKIGNLIADAYREHQSELTELLQPIVLKTVQDATDVIREEFQQSLKVHESQIRRLGDKYQTELVEQRLIPMIQDEIWPIVRQEVEPLALEIGQEMWAKVSVWRFGWRIIYDRSPLPQKNLFEKEFQRFLEKHGSPIIQEHVADFVSLQQTILSRVSKNEKVRQVVGETTEQVLSDSEFQALAAEILRDVFVDNERLMQAFERNWKTDEAVAAMEITNRRLEPTVTRIGQTLFGDPEQSITPEFSRVLRNRILHKDNRWLVLHLSTDRAQSETPRESIQVVQGVTGTENPFHVPKTNF